VAQIEITPHEVKQRLDRGEKFLLVDCREPWEYEVCRIAGAQLIPMGSVATHLQQLEAAEDVVVYCHHGRRSLDVVAWLQQQGVEGARSMAGGIERWSREIDPSVPRY
jgi:adenylyltransferase/sulfurtransferase